jgi:hypothetical protein
MRFDQLRRRDFVTLLGGAAAVWPLAARAQQASMPVIRYLSPTSAAGYPPYLAAFRQGLGQAGYVESENVAVGPHLTITWAYVDKPRLAAGLTHKG